MFVRDSSHLLHVQLSVQLVALHQLDTLTPAVKDIVDRAGRVTVRGRHFRRHVAVHFACVVVHRLEAEGVRERARAVRQVARVKAGLALDRRVEVVVVVHALQVRHELVGDDAAGSRTVEAVDLMLRRQTHAVRMSWHWLERSC